MAYADTHSTLGRLGLNTRVAGLSARWTARLQRNRRFRKTLNELKSLSDRDLADLGLSRSMLRGVAWESSAEG